MLKLLHLTDLHLMDPPPADRRDPMVRTQAALADIRARHGDAAGLMLTGDLADAGAVKAYDRLVRALDGLGMPVWAVPGNHDARDPLAAAFGVDLAATDGFMQQAIDLAGLSLILLDTLDPGRSGGRFCQARAAWARAALADRRDRPVIVGLHHPPMVTGMRFMDAIRLAPEDADRLADTLAVHPDILHIFFGHVHRPVTAKWRGYSLSSQFGPNHQLDLDLTSTDVHLTDGPGCYGVILVAGRDVVVHQQSFTGEWPATPLGIG